MEKKKVQAMAVAVFAAVLFIFAMTEGSRQSELGEIQEAMRRLNWLDNLQYSYVYTYSTQEETSEEKVEVWADLLTENWAAEYYLIDEDGMLPILKQYSDGKTLYHYIDWTGEWTPASEADEQQMPKLDTLMRLAYTAEDIEEVVRTQEDGKVIISYLFTQEYLDRTGNENIAQMEQMYQSYENAATSQEELDSLQAAMEQYRKTRREEVRITYVIDENGILQSGVCTVTLVQPKLSADETKAAALEEETQMQYEMKLAIKGYNQDSILDKIEWYREEI